jgi:chromosome segregation ATPase
MPPQMGVEDDNGPQQRALLRELTDIESKVIWELENWKRAEEARFRYNLKQRESEFVEKLRADWRQKEIDRDKVKRSLTIQVFKEMENKMAAHTQKMQNKLNQLNKRESRIILLEEELKQKIAETSRQLAMKDNETDDQKAKMADEKKNLQKRIKELEDKNRKLEEITKNLEEDLRLYKIEQEKSPIELVKRELNERILEIGQLRKEIEKTEEIKEEYRKHFDRLKEEVIKLKRERDQVIIEANSKHDKELAVLKNQLTQIGQGGQLGGDKPNYNSLREELYRIKGGPAAADNFQGQGAMTHPAGGFNQYQSPASAAKYAPSIGGQQAPPQQHPGIQTSGAYTDSQEYANYTRLKNERALLLKQGYLESDPLVTQIDEALKRLRD